MSGCLYRLFGLPVFNQFHILNMSDSTASVIRLIVDSNLSDAQLGAAVRAMYATKKTTPSKKTTTKPELLSKEQFLEKFPNGNVSGAVVGKFFNIKGRVLPSGLQAYNPIEGKPHQNIRVIPTEGGGAGYVPPGGDVDYFDTKVPATSDGASLELTAPDAPKKQSSTKSFTSDGVANSVAMELSDVLVGEQ